MKDDFKCPYVVTKKDFYAIEGLEVHCVVCGEKVNPCWDDDECSLDMPDSAISGVVFGGYGSSHDLCEFLVTVCDKCINDRVAKGWLPRILKGFG